MKKIPTYLIHGSLGSGKTTLLQTLLSSSRFKGSVVIENEYANYNFDKGVLNENDGEINIYDISGGCICCSSGQELFEALSKINKSSKVKNLFIETTGVASSVQLIQNLMLSDEFDGNFVLVKNILVIDIFEDSLEMVEKNRVLDIAMADLIVLNKSDLVNKKKLNDFEKFLKSTLEAKIVVTKFGQVSPEFVYSETKSKSDNVLMSNINTIGQLKDHSKETLYQVLYLKKKIMSDELKKLLKSLESKHSARVDRVKGVFTNELGRKITINATRSNFEFRPTGDNKLEDVLVIIGKNVTKSSVSELSERLC